MILQRVEQGDWLSNAYLVVDEIGGTGVLIDSNAVTDPLCERAEREGTTITHILLTHHHYDHVVGVEKLAERFDVPVLAHPICKDLVGDAVTGTIDHGDVLETGDLKIEAIHTPGHCAGHVSLLVEGGETVTLFGGDLVFWGGTIVAQNIHDCSLPDYAASVARVYNEVEFEALLPGHLTISLRDGKRHFEKAHNIFSRLGVPRNAV